MLKVEHIELKGKLELWKTRSYSKADVILVDVKALFLSNARPLLKYRNVA